MFSTIFWLVPALRRVDPVKTSGPFSTSIATWACLLMTALVLQDSAAVAAATSVVERADDVGGATGRGDADDHVVGPHGKGTHVAGTQFCGVLGAFDGLEHGLVTAREDANDLTGWGVEGGRAFGRIQDAQASAGACPGVDRRPPWLAVRWPA